MFDLIHELYTILNKIKGFKAGYSSSVDNRIIIDYKTKRYIITLDEIENPSSDMTDDIPQKPREHYHWGDFTNEEKLENNQWFCGKCDWQIGEEDNYCNECGQRVDWS